MVFTQRGRCRRTDGCDLASLDGPNSADRSAAEYRMSISPDC
jgi:hypothetical protein